MAQEFEPIQQIEKRRAKVAHVLTQRKALVDRIGTGTVSVGSSWEATLKVGRVRRKTRASVNRLQGELGQLDQELTGYNQARDYLSQIALRQAQLTEMSEMVAEGNLPQDILRRYQQEYETLTSLPVRNPTLQREIARVRQEEEARKRQQDAETPQPIPPSFVIPRVEPEEPRQAEPQGRSVTPAAGSVEPDDGRRGSERFKLPTGEEVGGKVGELLRLVAEGSPDRLLRSDRLAQQLFPGVEDSIARQRLSVLMTQARKKINGTGLDLVNVIPQSERLRGQKGGYYLRQAEQQGQPSQPVQVEIPASVEPTVETSTASGFQFEDGKIVEGEAGKILAELAPFSSEHIVTYKDLLRAVGAHETLDNLQVLDQHLKRTREILHQRSLRLAHVPNPKDARNMGYYVESIRRPNVRVTLLGDVIKYGNKKVRLSEEQYRLIWALASNISDPKFDRNLSERAFNQPDLENSPLPQVAEALSEQLTELTGIEGIITTGGNEEFGHFHKIKNVTILRRPGYFPVHPTRLEALHLLLQDTPSTAEVIGTLGVTKEKRRTSHPLTEQQAVIALIRAVTRLRNRASADIVTDPEAHAYLEMIDYMDKHKLADEKVLFTDIARKLGISHNSSAQEAMGTVAITEELVTGEATEPETTGVEKTPRTIFDPEFGTLSRADVTMIAAAMRNYSRELRPIVEARGVQLIEESILGEIVRLRDEPLADFNGMTREKRDRFINNWRVQALEKAQEMIASQDFDRIMEQIYEQNPDVYYLLFNLSEMDKVKVMNGTDIKKGITFLKDLVANPAARKFGFSGIEEQKPEPAPHSRKVDGTTTKTKAVVLFDAQAALPVEAKTVEPAQGTSIQAAPVVSRTPVVPEAPKQKLIEARDPHIRARVNQYLDDILAQPVLSQPVSPAYFTHNFPRIKQKFQDDAVKAGYVSTQPAKHRDQFTFDVSGMATVLYLYDYGTNLPPQLKKQVQDVVAEELKKRQEKK